MTDLKLDPKERFYQFYELDINAARCSGNSYVDSLELKGLTAEQQVVKLFRVSQDLVHDADGHRRKDYLIFADNRYCLYNIYFCHQLIYQCDEQPHLLEGLTLFEKLKCIVKLLNEAKAQLPLFTYADFLNGVFNVVFYILGERPTGTSKKDYLKMRNYQTQKKVDCINQEFRLIRERFMNRVADNACVMDCVRTDLQLLKDLYEKEQPLTCSQLTAILSKLTGLLPGSLPEDLTEFQELLCKFDERKNSAFDFSPKMLQLAQENILAGKLSGLPLCCWSLMKFKKWLTDLLEGKIGLNDRPDIDYEQLFYLIYDKAIDHSKTLMSSFRKKYPFGTVSHKVYKSMIGAELKKCRKEINNLKYPEYYQLLLNKENAKYFFINQCFMEDDCTNQVYQLEQTIVLNEMIKFFKDKLFRIDPGLVNPRLNFTNLKNDLEEIFSMTVPYPEISERLQKTINEAYQALSKKMPLLFIVENLQENIDEIFSDTIINLNDQLDSQPGIIKETYAKKLLMELWLRPLVKPEFGQGLEKYVKKLKDFLKMTLKYTLSEQSSPLDHTENPYNDLQMEEIKTEIPRILAFNCKNLDDDGIRPGLRYLIKLGAIPPDTTEAQLLRLFNGQEVTEPLEWWAGQGDLMVFIREMVRINDPEFAPYNQHWNIAERCFVQKGGEKFDAQKLRFSKPTLLEHKFIKAAGKFK